MGFEFLKKPIKFNRCLSDDEIVIEHNGRVLKNEPRLEPIDGTTVSHTDFPMHDFACAKFREEWFIYLLEGGIGIAIISKDTSGMYHGGGKTQTECAVNAGNLFEKYVKGDMDFLDNRTQTALKQYNDARERWDKEHGQK